MHNIMVLMSAVEILRIKQEIEESALTIAQVIRIVCLLITATRRNIAGLPQQLGRHLQIIGYRQQYGQSGNFQANIKVTMVTASSIKKNVSSRLKEVEPNM